MKQGTLYAARLKKAFARVVQSNPAPKIPEPDDPMRRLALGILGVQDGEAAAARALDRLFTVVVDWNDIRVSTAAEAHAAIGDALSDGRAPCMRLRTALQSVFDSVNLLSLDHLKKMGRRDARQYLESLDGVDEFAAAGVVLWSLGGHATPVDDRLLGSLRAAKLVHPEATRAEVQAFLERHISAADAKKFCLLMRHFTAPKKTTKKAVKKGKRSPAGRKKAATRGAAVRTSRSGKRITKKR